MILIRSLSADQFVNMDDGIKHCEHCEPACEEIWYEATISSSRLRLGRPLNLIERKIVIKSNCISINYLYILFSYKL